MKRDCEENLIIDFPTEHQSTKLFSILFDIYDCEILKSDVAIDSSFKALVNLFPRNPHYDNELSIKSEEFLTLMKYFDDVAFLDLDVPIESAFTLKLRSKLIYDQFCHFFTTFRTLNCATRITVAILRLFASMLTRKARILRPCGGYCMRFPQVW